MTVPDPDRERVAALKASFAQAFASEADFRAFYDQALPRIYGYLHDRCGGDPMVAEELTQQTFVAAVRERSRFDGRSEPMTWLTAIARHKLADHFRRLEREERRRVRLVAREIQVDPDPAVVESGRRALDRAPGACVDARPPACRPRPPLRRRSLDP